MSKKGKDSISGFYYQTAVGVLRLFDMLKVNGPYKIEYEGIDEYSEDITLFWEDKTLYEQVKRRGNNVWTQGKIKEIIPIAFDREHIQRISERFDFVWGFHYSSDLRDQVSSIRRICVKTIQELCNIDYDSALLRFSELCEFVFHVSSKIPGIVLRKDVRSFLPEYFDMQREKILEEIEESFRVTLSEVSFDYLEINKQVRISGSSIKIDIYMEIDTIRVCIWRLGNNLTAGEIRSIHDSVRSLHMYRHAVIIRDKRQLPSLPNELRSISIPFNDVDGLMIRIQGDDNAQISKIGS